MAVVGPFQSTVLDVTAFQDSIAPTFNVNRWEGDLFMRTRVTVPPGVTTVWYAAVPIANNFRNTIGIWVDNVYTRTDTFAGADGVKEWKSFSVTGAGHVIDFENQAYMTDVASNLIAEAYTPPVEGVVQWGNSIMRGVNATVFSKAYVMINRHTLMPGGIKTTNWGVSGKAMASSGGDGPGIVARLRGTSKNVVPTDLGVNDWVQGRTLAAYNTAALNVIDTVRATNPNVIFLFIGMATILDSTGTYAIGLHTTDYNAQMVATAASRPNCSYLDMTGISTASIHPSDAEFATMAPPIAAAIQAL